MVGATTPPLENSLVTPRSQAVTPCLHRRDDEGGFVFRSTMPVGLLTIDASRNVRRRCCDVKRGAPHGECRPVCRTESL
jgi:hypothetical protein